MCAIVGFASPEAASPRSVLDMARLMRHRGPDDEGYVLVQRGGLPTAYRGPDTPADKPVVDVPWWPRIDIRHTVMPATSVALGHRRLSILDLSPAGHQPMSSADGRFWLVFNGEIYNHEALRQELKGRGHRFLTSTDTEVLLAAYVEWGAECLHRLKGMWGFAIYDARKQEIFLARDRFGIKPVYYWFAPDGTFCFASEIKAFTAFPGWSAKPNRQRCYDFLAWGMLDHTDETLFAGVYQLAPGHSIKARVGDLKPDASGRIPGRKWYELRPRAFEGDFRDACTGFGELLVKSVEEHLQADVPLGSCLSGGLDSSSIVCLVNQLLRNRADARRLSFSACARDSELDERHWIDEVVRHTGVEAHYIYPDLEHLLRECEAIAWHQDEPFNSTSIYAQWSVFGLAASRGVKVMLDGQGADEMLAGYRNFFGARLASLFKSANLRGLAAEASAMHRVHGYPARRLAMSLADSLLPEGIRQPLRSWYGVSSSRPAWLNLRRLGAVAGDPANLPHANVRGSVNELSKSQLTGCNLQMLLHWEDRNSMAHSLESRVPFLDHELVEFSLGLPEAYKLERGVTKRVLRGSMDGILPDRIRDRMDKIGFATPEERWLRGAGGAFFEDQLRIAVQSSNGILNGDAIKLLKDIRNGRAPYSSTVWRMISFGEWIEAFSVDAGGSEVFRPASPRRAAEEEAGLRASGSDTKALQLPH